MGKLQLSLALTCLYAIATGHSARANCTLSSRQVTQLKGCTFLEPVSETTCSGTCPSVSQIWLDNDPGREFSNCMCCQASSSSQVTVEMECPGRPYTMAATCDNTLTVWFDGVRQDAPASALSNWEITSTFSVPPCTRVVGIQCEDAGGVGAILASLSNGVVTDGGWDCSTVPTNNWQYPGFVGDSDWQSASVHSQHGSDPWKIRPGISTDASWIWTSDFENHDNVYCRRVVMDEYADCTAPVEAALPPATTMTATCDNEMKVYFDDELQTGSAEELNDWTKTSTFAVPTGAQKVTIDCLDTVATSAEGILASFDNGLVTDSSWDCQALPLSQDASPVPALVIGPNGMGPWDTFSDIDNAAQWIWTPTQDEVDIEVRCTRYLTPRPAVTRVPFTYTVAQDCDCRPCGGVLDLPIWYRLSVHFGEREYLRGPCC